jgi:hypothetical protein
MRASLGAAVAAIVTASSCAYPKQSPHMLSCEPQVLTSADTLTLQFGDRHPAELGIRAPDQTWFFLVYDHGPGLSAGVQPIVDKASFRKLKTMSLPVAAAEGTPWEAGRHRNERIFQMPGEYEVVLTDVLESDAGYPRYGCRVRFDTS